MPKSVPEHLDREAFFRVLQELLGNRYFALLPNPGNAGDGLINAAAWQILDRLELSSHVMAVGDIPSGCRVCVYSGGGNLVGLYPNSSSSKACERFLASKADLFVMLPQTVRDNVDLLSRMDERFHLFCRDVTSWHHVTRHAPLAHVYLADDLALGLDIARLLSSSRRLECLARLSTSARLLKRYVLWRRRIGRITPAEGRLRLMRVDIEAGSGGARDSVYDLSAQYSSAFLSRYEAELVSSDFLRVLSLASRVESDRLHVAIGASLLGKETVLYDNSYGKNRAIYDLSIAGRFSNTNMELLGH